MESSKTRSLNRDNDSLGGEMVLSLLKKCTKEPSENGEKKKTVGAETAYI